MRRSLNAIAFSAFALVAASSPATAAEVRVLGVDATQVAAKAIGAEFERLTGHKVVFTFRPPFHIDKELADKAFDALIVSVPAMDAHDQAGHLAPVSRMVLARVGVGMVVREGAPVPDVSTAEKLKAAVLAARSLTYVDPAMPNTSGAIAGAALARLGILDQIKDKVRHAATIGGELVAKGEAEIGFFNLSEIPAGTTLAGPLPALLQGYTVYQAAVLANGSRDSAVKAFVRYLASEAASGHWSRAKLEPAGGYMSPRAADEEPAAPAHLLTSVAWVF